MHRLAISLLLLFAGTSSTLCQETASPEKVEVESDFESKQAAAARLVHMTKHAQSFKGTVDSTKVEIRPVAKPLLRWTNAYSNIKDGILAAWVDESGRPIAMGQICLIPDQEDQWCVEMQSLTSEKFELAAEFNGPWKPRSPGVQWKPLREKAKKPLAIAKTETLRLIQMRNFAREFQCEDDFDSDENPLRLLTAPLIRYKDPKNGVVDAAMFAMVHGTDPELIVLIELRKEAASKKSEYFYALAPMTSFELNASRGGEKVWHKPKMESNLATDIFWQRQLAESAPPKRGLLERLLGL